MPTVQVSPKEKNPTHHISLSDGIRTYGLILDGGPRGIQEVPQTPSTLKFSGGGTKFGDWEPGFSHIEKRDWSGGRGQENFSDDATRFRDSQNCWTMTPERLTPGPQWEMGSRLVGEAIELPAYPPWAASGVNNDVTWIALLSTRRYQAARITPAATLTADKAYLWVRRIGQPGTLTVEIRTNTGASGPPTTTVLKSVTKTVTDIADTVSTLVEFDWTGTEALAAATAYNVVIYGASTDTHANHWEVGMDSNGVTTAESQSTDGITWVTPPPARLYFHVVESYGDRKFYLFEMDGATYAVDSRTDGTAAALYLNGARGKATSATSTVLTNTNAALGTDTYKLAYIRIIRGTGIGQVRQITSHSATAVTTAAWDITPDSTSEYVIYDTRYWNVIATTGLTQPATSVAVVNNIAYVAQGNATNIRRIRFNPAAAPPAHEFADDGTNKADLLYTYYVGGTGAVIWRAFNASTVQISRATAAAWGTDLVFGTGIGVGDTSFAITGLTDYDGVPYVFKWDSAWKVVSDVPEKLAVGLGTSPDENNGKACLSLGLFLYFSYMASVERLYGSTLDDVGPWRGTGLPSGRAGKIVSMTSAYAWLFAAIDAGASGYSSVMCYDGRGWHELFRAPVAGKRIRTVYVQNNPGSRPKVWFDLGGLMGFFRLPLDTLRPLNDAGYLYQHEAVLIDSVIDMGAGDLPKFFEALSVLSENLEGGINLRVDYQLDDDVGYEEWIPAGKLFQSPEDSLDFGVGNKRQLAYRIRLLTDDADVPAVVKATVVKAFARTPLKYQYLLKIKVADQQSDLRGNRDSDPDELMYWLKAAAAGARKITMRSLWEQMDNLSVIVEPPTLIRQFTDPILSWWGGVTTITLREK